MCINTYYKNQLGVAIALKDIIDDYWGKRIEEEEMIYKIKSIIANNNDKIFVNGEEYCSIVKQRCGKFRLDLIDKVRRGGDKV